MSQKVMTSLKLPASLEQTLLQRVIGDGYGMRGKSRWIAEAIQQFMQLPNYPELVDIATDMSELPKMVSVRLESELVERLDQAMITVRKQYPMMEGVKSNIIRASIMQRLIRKPTSVTEH